ncbi:hypothetical protein CTI12_AA460750 [Artemisia annua]|uniref:ATPase, F1/V1/A1 complex, alpha/beta subunit, Zinc knuckle CX2CX4HX4C n=1 Tax=Artemisia annua TaxID=35608 RepID=A0A2U1LS17_ARTAN|nr:hypothetical protein CTI12_AA460750 [Artemisia annua]
MDAMTTRMCTQGVGRLGFARVLVEANASKGLDDSIDVVYKNREDGNQFVKKVQVTYDWKPPVCSHCKVFGHSFEKCLKRDRTGEQVVENQKDDEGFVQNNNRKTNQNKDKKQMPQVKPKEKVAAPQKVYKQVEKPNDSMPNGVNEQVKATQTNQRKTWNVDKEIVQAVRVTANRYSALESLDEEQGVNHGNGNKQNLSEKDKETVNDCVSRKFQPSCYVTEKWSHQMRRYFKDCWEEKYGKDDNYGNVILNEKEVYVDK